MSIENLQALLETLKRIKQTKELGSGNSVGQYISVWLKDYANDDQRTKLILQTKFLAEMQITIQSAQSFIDSLELLPEAREGVNSILHSMAFGFSSEGSNNSIQSYFPAIEASILSLAMLMSVLQMKMDLQTPGDKMDEIIDELRGIISSFRSLDLKDELKEKILQHLLIVIFLCENYRYVGIDAALSSYIDTAIRIDRAVDISKKEEVADWFTKLKSWGGKLKSAGEIAENSEKLIETGKKIADFLS